MDKCKLSKPFVESLRSSVGLNRFCCKFSFGDSCDLLRFNWPELEIVSIECSFNFNTNQMEKLLECNPQLKTVMLNDYDDIDGGDILQTVAKHQPLIERLAVHLTTCIGQSSFGRDAFKSLRCLHINCNGVSITSVISEMAAAQVPLKHVTLLNCPSDGQLVDVVSVE